MAAGSVAPAGRYTAGLTALLLALLAAPGVARAQDQPADAAKPAQAAQPTEAAAAAPAEEGDQQAQDRETLRNLMKADLETLLNTPIDVSTPTKTVQKSYEAPAIVTTVTRDQIAVWGYHSVAELLSHVLGFFVVDDLVSPNLAVRGSSGGLYSDSSIVKVLIDGQSVAFSSTGGNALGPELIPLSAIDRVEIVRVLASDEVSAQKYFAQLKADLARDWNQQDFLIVSRQVTAL